MLWIENQSSNPCIFNLCRSRLSKKRVHFFLVECKCLIRIVLENYIIVLEYFLTKVFSNVDYSENGFLAGFARLSGEPTSTRGHTREVQILKFPENRWIFRSTLMYVASSLLGSTTRICQRNKSSRKQINQPKTCKFDQLRVRSAPPGTGFLITGHRGASLWLSSSTPHAGIFGFSSMR